MKQPPVYFERIRESAVKRWKQLEGDPELAGPWHQLFKQVQSPRHVLSELLQNADDAGATQATVSLDDGQFVFSHNGEDFAEDHFASLCRFGYSNKRALHTIGFRGIGFKSTFSLGDTVELSSPTLSVAFHKNRFTAPEWLQQKRTTSTETQVRVLIASANRKKEIEKNLEEWIASPVSLLFFKHIRHLRIGDFEACWETLGPGPVPDSEWMALKGKHHERFLIARSPLEVFPEDALAEIRQERLLGADQEMAFPPCKVEIVLGASGRLYVVLPTGVETDLPFACNAPFIQDPARMKIKDPETSPTNQWLLERVGKLAGEAMLQWLNAVATIEDRAAAYGLLPDVDRKDNSLEGVCATIVEESCEDVLNDAPLLLTHLGEVVSDDGSIAVPEALLAVWPAEKVAEYFDAQSRPPLSCHISSTNRRKLLRWGFLEEIDADDVVAVLETKHIPKPESWGQLLLLWVYLAPEFHKLRIGKRQGKLRILPVQGGATLHSADEIVRLGEKRLLQSEDDWVFLAKHLLVLNQNWTRYLAEQRRRGDEGDLPSEAVESAFAMLEQIGLNEASDANEVIAQVATKFFVGGTLPVEQCVQFTQIAAKLGAAVDNSFLYVTTDGYLRSVGSTILADPDGRLESLFDEKWCNEHFLRNDYLKEFKACTGEEWRQWIKSGRSGLLGFAPLVACNQWLRGKAAVSAELRRRGMGQAPVYPYVTNQFQIEDWDFQELHWLHWTELAKEDPNLWGHIVDRIIEQPESWAAKAKGARILQTATTGTSRSVTWQPLVPAWILKLREFPCLRDTRGRYHKPAELLRRTPETESLMDVEPFVDARLDTEATRWLLTLLDVRDVPTGPARLLDCLRALAQSKSPPVHEVEKWYGRLDQMIEHCSTQDFAAIRKAFHDEKIILTSAGEWSTSAGIFLGADEEDVPGVALVRISVRDLMLWRKVDVAERPTVDLALQWLQALPSGKTVPQEEARRVKMLLARHPERVWYECAHWLNLAGEWVAVDTLRYSFSMQSMVAWAHLHKWVKQATADFQRLPAELVNAPPFAALSPLALHIDERFHRKQPFAVAATVQPWLQQLGLELQRYVAEDEAETGRIRALAASLAATSWQVTQGLETIAYIDGTPAGMPRQVEALWLDRTLFVEKRPFAKLALAVAQELGRAFQKAEISDAIKLCVDRSPAFVTEYMEQNFKLATRDEAPVAKEEGRTTPQSDKVGKGAAVTDPVQPGGIREPQPTAGGQEDQTKSEGIAGILSVPDPTLEPLLKPTPHPAPQHKPVKPSMLERFATENGFKKHGDNRYVHVDGRSIARSNGNRFPWELLSAAGELLCCYLPREHCLEREALQLDSDVWAMLDQNPQTYALMLESLSGQPAVLSGTHLRELRDDGKITLYPATYRLVFDNDNQ